MHVKKTITLPKEREIEVEDHLICTYYSNLSDAIRDRLRKILAEYRRKNEIEIAATLYKEGKITLREAAAIMDAPMRKTLEELGREGRVSEIWNGRTRERILDDHCKRFHPAHPFWNDQAPPSSSIHVRSDRNHRSGAQGSGNRRNRSW